MIDVLDRIAKLLALGESNPNEHEAAYDHHAREEGRRAGDRIDISRGGKAALGSGHRAIGGGS